MMCLATMIMEGPGSYSTPEKLPQLPVRTVPGHILVLILETGIYLRRNIFAIFFANGHTMIGKNFNGFIVIIVVMNFRKKFRTHKLSHPNFLPFLQIFSSAK